MVGTSDLTSWSFYNYSPCSPSCFERPALVASLETNEEPQGEVSMMKTKVPAPSRVGITPRPALQPCQAFRLLANIWSAAS